MRQMPISHMLGLSARLAKHGFHVLQPKPESLQIIKPPTGFDRSRDERVPDNREKKNGT